MNEFPLFNYHIQVMAPTTMHDDDAQPLAEIFERFFENVTALIEDEAGKCGCRAVIVP